ncbi:hypothetical protein [Algiphilus sp.]|uniref:hypothetical protein n=1 Tax=Algiphilus sp. TaxID=1872431 RepID=UPI003CCB860D
MKLIWLALLAMAMTACSNGSRSAPCPDSEIVVPDFPDSWDVKAIHTRTIIWVEVYGYSLPIECGDTQAPGCTVYGPEWNDGGPCLFGAADPQYWGWETAMGQRREGTLGHEGIMHCFLGSFH